MSGPIKVLYIGGTGRTGSTLLSQLFGQLPGVFDGGELAFLWRYGIGEGGKCSCGERLVECQVWQRAFRAAYGPSGIDAQEMVALRRRANSVHLPLMVSRTARSLLLRRLGAFPERVEALYRALLDTTGSRLLVDSSKEPHYSWILRSRPALDVRFLHLVRDPRAIAHSWTRHREELGLGPGAEIERRRPVVSATYHNVSNVAAEALWARSGHPYLRLRYEDLVADPGRAFELISELAGEDLDPSTVLRGGFADVRPTHSAWGNPKRFRAGRVPFEADTAWRTEMATGARWTIMALTGPLLVRYGYPLRSRRALAGEPVGVALRGGEVAP